MLEWVCFGVVKCGLVIGRTGPALRIFNESKTL